VNPDNVENVERKSSVGAVDTKGNATKRVRKDRIRHFMIPYYFVPIYERNPTDLCPVTYWTLDGCPDATDRLLAVREYGFDPRPYVVFSQSEIGSVRVVYYCGGLARLMISARGLHSVYKLAEAVHAVFFLFGGEVPQHIMQEELLIEVKRPPRLAGNEDELLESIQPLSRVPLNLRDIGLEGGRCVNYDDMFRLIAAMPRLIEKDWLRSAVVHLGHSQFLCFGHMSGSYYQCHYRHERLAQDDYERTRMYFENRHRYELAFVAAYMGIESFLGVGQMKRRDIGTLLAQREIPEIKAESEYERLFEIFSGRPKMTTYGDLIVEFLDKRNAVAAHANPSPPEQLLVKEDSVFEIQALLRGLCSTVLGLSVPNQVPSDAVFLQKRRRPKLR
jgi:hypothetical protein